MTRLITFDGAKGVGKSTLIGALASALHERGCAVSVLVEKTLMAQHQPDILQDAYARLKSERSASANLALATLHRERRLIISAGALARASAEVVLMDRWYPSDAVFRECVDVDALIEQNISSGVMVPDIAVAVVCDSRVSWQRACGRVRALDSKVIDSYYQHRASSKRFERAARDHRWRVLRSDHYTPGELAGQLLPDILPAR